MLENKRFFAFVHFARMAIGHPAFCRRGKELTRENEEPLKSQTAVSGIYFMVFHRFFAESIGGVFLSG
jgi:hypothetical protein